MRPSDAAVEVSIDPFLRRDESIECGFDAADTAIDEMKAGVHVATQRLEHELRVPALLREMLGGLDELPVKKVIEYRAEAANGAAVHRGAFCHVSVRTASPVKLAR